MNNCHNKYKLICTFYINLMESEKVHHLDAELEAMLGRFNISQPKALKCDNAKAIERMCINPDCQEVSLLCSDYSC